MSRTITTTATVSKASKASKPSKPSKPAKASIVSAPAASKPAKPKAQAPATRKNQEQPEQPATKNLTVEQAASTMLSMLSHHESADGNMEALNSFFQAKKITPDTPKKTIQKMKANYPNCAMWAKLLTEWNKASKRAKKSFTNQWRYMFKQDGKKASTGKVSAALLCGLLGKASDGACEAWSIEERSNVMEALEALREALSE